MSRKDYVAIAAALARTRPNIDDPPYTTHSYIGNNTMVDHISFDAALLAWAAARTAIANVLAADNPRFDRQRFIAATEA